MYQGIDVEEVLRQVFGDNFLTPEQFDKKIGAKLVSDVEKGHKQMRQNLGGRVQVLRVLLEKYFAPRRERMSEWDFSKGVEKYLDNILAKKNYRIEPLIDGFRKLVSQESGVREVCPNCGYVPPFCVHYSYDTGNFDK